MTNTFHQTYLQTVLAVKFRQAILDKAWSHEVFNYIASLLNYSYYKKFIVNGVEDQVHLLFAIQPRNSVSDVIKGVNAKSLKCINDNKLTPAHLKWQRGFGVFSYQCKLEKSVYKCIERQDQHRHKKTMIHEYSETLNEHQIQYDTQVSLQRSRIKKRKETYKHEAYPRPLLIYEEFQPYVTPTLLSSPAPKTT